MHICFLTNEYPQPGYPHGGIGSFIKTLGEALVLHGLDVSVVDIGHRDFNEHENDHGIEIYRIASAKSKRVTWYLNSRKINKQIDCINSIRPINVIEASEMGLAFIKKRDNIKYVIRLHGGHHFFAEAENRGINWEKGLKEKRSIGKADIIIGVSNYVQHQTTKYIDLKRRIGPVIYNPVDVEKFYEADPGKIIKGRIFFAGTVCEKKGIRQLLQAMPHIIQERPDAHLHIAGHDGKLYDGRSFTEYLRRSIPAEILCNITFLGSVQNNDIPGLIEQAEVCVFPSHMETFGLAAIEAMSMGKPVVFTIKGPGPEVIKDGVTGLLCNPLDPQDIADKTLKILKNFEYGIILGEAARREVIERFSIKKLAEQNIEFYRILLES